MPDNCLVFLLEKKIFLIILWCQIEEIQHVNFIAVICSYHFLKCRGNVILLPTLLDTLVQLLTLVTVTPCI